MSIVNLIINYLRQPSTYAGGILVAIAATFGISADGVELIGAAFVAIIGLVEFFRNKPVVKK